MDQLLERVNSATNHIVGIRNKQAQRDLIRMLKTLDANLNELDRESVECRRLHKTTARYQTLESQCVLLLDNLEKHIIYARLLYG